MNIKKKRKYNWLEIDPITQGEQKDTLKKSHMGSIIILTEGPGEQSKILTICEKLVNLNSNSFFLFIFW